MVQYVLPSAVELSYVYAQQTGHALRGVLRQYFLTVAAAAAIISLSFRGMLLTGMFFHTGPESLVAVGINLLLVFLPVLGLTCSPYFVSKIMSLNESREA